jgi:methyl-accepting chemotaxis protein
MSQALTNDAASINGQADRQVGSAERLVLIVAAVSIVLALLITIRLAASIVTPLRRMTAAAERIAEGDLEVEVGSGSDDELGRLAAAFQASVKYLTEIANAAVRIAGGDLTGATAPKPERDVLGQAFMRMRATLASTLDDVARSSQSVGAASAEMAQSSQQTGLAVGEIADAVGSVAAGAETQVRSLEQALATTEQVTHASQTSGSRSRGGRRRRPTGPGGRRTGHRRRGARV